MSATGDFGGPGWTPDPGQGQPPWTPDPGQGQPPWTPAPGQDEPPWTPAPGQGQPPWTPVPGQGQPPWTPDPGQDEPPWTPVPGQDQSPWTPVPDEPQWTPDPRLPPSEILKRYQVDDDPKGTVDYPTSAPENWFDRRSTIMATEARMLDGLGYLEKWAFREIRKDAIGVGVKRFPGQQGNDSHRDAFRHAYWNALLVREFGVEWAEKYTTAHEAPPQDSREREAMDLYNNELGRRIAIENPSAPPEELADLIDKAVREGQAVVIDRNGNLKYSNQVPEGETRVVKE